MPQRFLRPGITNSELWNAVSSQAGNLFIRLLTIVDDFGRTDGRSSVLLGQCFSVWNALHARSRVTLQQLDAMCSELQHVKLIDVYSVDGKRVLQILQWQERIREGCRAKWPENPTVAATRGNLLPSSPVHHRPSSSSSIVGCAEEIYAVYPRKVAKPSALKAIQKALLRFDGTLLLERTRQYAEAVKNSDPDFIPHPSTWFNQDRFSDEPSTWRKNGAHKKPVTESGRGVGTANEGRSGDYSGIGRVPKHSHA